MIYIVTVNWIGVVAFYNSVFNGHSTSWRDVTLQNYNSNCSFVQDGALNINKPGKYVAYLFVAHGQLDGGHGSSLRLMINDEQVKGVYFDRIASNDTGGVAYEFTVNKEQTVKINCQVVASQDYSNGASTASVLIVKNN